MELVFLFGNNIENGYRKSLFPFFLLGLLTLHLSVPGKAVSQPQPAGSENISLGELDSLSLEELVNIKVTSVSKKKEDLWGASSAIYVITQEDIRRSGATNIPESLRIVPGLHVAHLDSNTWAVTSRGFNSRFANKLLVLIDGRTIYSSVFSGVFWDAHDTVLEDIDRIEVIRGPGATIWGANAVNGVINIITKKAQDTEGLLVSSGAGTEERGFGTFRYGGKIRKKGNFRVFGKYYNRDEFVGFEGERAADESEAARGGFRMDLDLSEKDTLTAQGNIYSGESGNRIKDNLLLPNPPFATSFDDETLVTGGHFLTKWERTLSNDSNLSLQLYFDRESRDFQGNGLEFTLDTYDAEFQHRFHWGKRQEITWGLNHRYIVDSFENSGNIIFTPDDRLNYNTAFFVQDAIQIIPEKLRLTLGSKFSANNYTGFEYQPSAKLAWTPNTKHTLWGSVSRAVRTPSRVTDSVKVNNRTVNIAGFNTVIQNTGSLDYDSEDLLAFESGYRIKVTEKLSFDIASFFNIYNEILTAEQESFGFDRVGRTLVPVVPLSFDNKGSGESYGIEWMAQWQPFEWWRLTGGFTWFQLDLNKDATSLDTTFEDDEDKDPEFQYNFRSYLSLPHNFEFDTIVYFVDSLESMDVSHYVRLDLRIGWKPIPELELSLVGQNLQDSKHLEFGNERFQFQARTQVERSIYGKVTWRY